MSENIDDMSKLLELGANTPDHEMTISHIAKTAVPGILGMIAATLEQAVPNLDGKDPLSAERYIHLADKLSEVAARLHKLGEASRTTAQYLEIVKQQKTGDTQ